MTIGSVDLRIGFAEVASTGFVTPHIRFRGRLAGAGIRPRLSFIASASDVIRLGRGRRVLGSEAPPVKMRRVGKLPSSHLFMPGFGVVFSRATRLSECQGFMPGFGVVFSRATRLTECQ